VYTKSKKFGYKARGCKYCKSIKVHWAETELGWVLFEKKDGNKHWCERK
jgi:hypothetical protein